MGKPFLFLFASTIVLGGAWAAPATAADQSSGRQMQNRGEAQIPVCTHRLGTLAIVPPDNPWWNQYSLSSPEAVIKIFVQRSGCFGLVNRGSAMRSREMERALAENGELQAGSNVGRGQVKTADYFLQPDIVNANKNSGGNNFGAALGGVLGHSHGWANTIGSIAGGININKGEANVTLSIVNARTTEEEAMVEGYARKTDIGWGAGGGAAWWGGCAAAGAGGYQNTEIGQIIVLAYLDAYTKLVMQLGGLPASASAAAPPAQ